MQTSNCDTLDVESILLSRPAIAKLRQIEGKILIEWAENQLYILTSTFKVLSYTEWWREHYLYFSLDSSGWADLPLSSFRLERKLASRPTEWKTPFVHGPALPTGKGRHTMVRQEGELSTPKLFFCCSFTIYRYGRKTEGPIRGNTFLGPNDPT